MASDSKFSNNNYDMVIILAYIPYQGTLQNLRILHGEHDFLRGVDQKTYYFVWKDKDEGITEDELNTYAIEGTFGVDNWTFGTPGGLVPSISRRQKLPGEGGDDRYLKEVEPYTSVRSALLRAR